MWNWVDESCLFDVLSSYFVYKLYIRLVPVTRTDDIKTVYDQYWCRLSKSHIELYLTDLEMLNMPNDKFDILVTHKLPINFE